MISCLRFQCRFSPVWSIFRGAAQRKTLRFRRNPSVSVIQAEEIVVVPEGEPPAEDESDAFASARSGEDDDDEEMKVMPESSIL